MPDQNVLVGSWQLLRWKITYADDRPETEPFGREPQGLIIYSRDGWMSASINSQPRKPLPAGAGLRKQPDDLLAACFRSYFHYAGRYRIEGDRVFHRVYQSLNPDLIGTVQERRFSLQDNNLVLQGLETAGIVQRTHTLTWQSIPTEKHE